MSVHAKYGQQANRWAFTVCGGMLLVCILILYVTSRSDTQGKLLFKIIQNSKQAFNGLQHTGPGATNEVVPTDPKTILWYFTPRYLPMNLTSRVPVSACPQSNCFVTRNRTFLQSSNAVIFNAQYIKGALPPRKAGQVWIFHNNEPPYLFADDRDFYKQPWSSAFNWTMTFRHDSDIFRPYALLKKRRTVPLKNYSAIVKKKTKLVAWMVSNCLDWSKRMAYGKELQKHIPVDIYGLCGKMTFRREQNKDWLKLVNETYKFYIGFENNYCKDYITEKFFNNFNLDLVTVVRGGGNYSRDAPPGTYINVDDFKSPKHLAEYLWFLHNNTDKYINILKRKEEYYYEAEEYLYTDPGGSLFLEHYYEQESLCEICRKLKNIENHSKTIPDIIPWWKDGICRNPTKPF
ncbi:glycoprotein 3-alpha-L-fucosyltransferase A-like isoform X1 [Haliotis cracherodii]|uniref:glycoprotein 3-alpha-L-fucosyltransferase A-like isoform X1 n=1 Tax=Haliotis cracherodii TaxID=6455 RepID=UPI0039E8372E